MAPRRNDPCPCGSGLKYKKCCLARQQNRQRRARVAENAQQRRNEGIGKAIDWLARHHETALLDALDDFTSAAVEDGRSLSEADADYLQGQATEWALAEGTTTRDGREVRLRDLVLEGGPLLDADQRRWIERSTEEPLRLWKVTDVTPGVGLDLENLLDPSAECVTVKERSASRMLRRFEVIAARLARWNDTWEIAAIYSIPDAEPLRLIEAIETTTTGDPSDPDVARRIGRQIRDTWIHLFTRRPPIPDIVDAKGNRFGLTTDHWQVVDHDEFVRRLEAQPDVIGSLEGGWTRVDDPDVDLGQTILDLDLVEGKDRLKTFATTRRAADEGRAWLESTAGSALRYLTREIVDPTSERFRDHADDDGRHLAHHTVAVPVPDDTSPDAPIPADVMQEMMETVYRRQYATLADDVIPILGNKSPRDLLKQPRGESKVRLWLEGFERNEQRMAAEQGRDPVDLGFVWEAIGLERDARSAT